MVKKKRRHEAEAEASSVKPRTELLNCGGPRDDEPKKRSGKKKRREGGGAPRHDVLLTKKKGIAKKKRWHEAEAETSGVEPRSELLGGGGGGGGGGSPRDDEPKKRSCKKKRREGGGAPCDDEPKKRNGKKKGMTKKKRRHEAEVETSGVEPWSELLGGGGGPCDHEPKKRSSKKKRREGGGAPRDNEPKRRNAKKKGMVKKKRRHEAEAETSGVEPQSELLGSGSGSSSGGGGGPRDDELKKRSCKKKRRQGGGAPRDDGPKKRNGKKKRQHEAKVEMSGVKPRSELLGSGGGPCDDELKKRSGKKRRREGGGSGGVPGSNGPKKRSGKKKRREGGDGSSGPRDNEQKKRSGKKTRRKGGEGGGKSGSIIDNAQSYELDTRVIASPLRIQETEKPTESVYEAFLSFRGPDTRCDIVDYLYNSLIRAGIRAYIDNEELPIGEEIDPELRQAIEQSEISIPILSKGYAASSSCLMELVHMVECKEKWGQKIMPIFYDITPAEVRYQTGSYGEAITSHKNKKRFTNETIEKWKTALSKVGDLRGWELKERGKGEFTEEVVRTLLIKLKKNNLAEPYYSVEMDDHVDKIMEKIGTQTTGTKLDYVDKIMEKMGTQATGTKVVGIHGMGGVGKTTLATIVYNKLSADFDNCCFLFNIRETNIVILQNQLLSKVLRMEWPSINSINEGITDIRERLSSKKVLLVLDDVDQITQLNTLVGTGECWFGRGSKVIITTRDKEVLKDVDFKYELTEMDFNHSLLLFSKHAFRRDHPPAEYVSLSKKALEICGHLPLALEIIGSFLAGKDKEFWVVTLERLKAIPSTEVKSRLNISFEALEPREKEIFLDVCCFFVGSDVRTVTYMWASRKLFPEYSLEVLKRKSLMKIVEDNQLWVHDQLRDLGRDIVRERANLKLEKQSRVWDHEESIDVLERKEGRESVEAMRLKFDRPFRDFIEKEESINLPKLRFLQVDCGDLDESNGQHFHSTNLCQRNPIMPPNLIMLSWHNFPVYFEFITICLKKLMILDLSKSKITDEWEGWNHLKMTKNLKVLNLTGCGNLHRTLDLSAHENLEQLILQGCTELVEVHRSIGRLKHLVLLNLEYCEKLQTLPDEMEEIEDLRELLLDGTSITKIPEWKGMEKLETLNAANCKLLSECNLAGCSKSLSYLYLSDTRISELPFENFGSLVELYLDGSNIRELPNSIKTMKKLRVLDISKTSIKKLPSALGMLKKLEVMIAESCSYLSGEMPSEIGNLPFLRGLSLSRTNISNIPKLPESMDTLYLSENVELRCPDLSNLLNLRLLKLKLECQSASDTQRLNWIGRLGKLEGLWLYCDMVTLPSDFNLLSQLRNLEINVDNLECLSKLPQNLSTFWFCAGQSMVKSINLSYLEKLSVLLVYSCEQLTEIQGLESLKNLRSLTFSELPSLVKLPDFTGLKKLRGLLIVECQHLVGVQGQLEWLESLHIESCQSIVQLPDPLSFKHMKELIIFSCRKLREIQGLEVSENLRVLRVDDFPLLEKLPDLTNAKELKHIELMRCPRLVEIQGRLKSVVSLLIDGCGSLQKFSDPSSFKKLEDLQIKECERLEEIMESDEYRDLKEVRRPFQGSKNYLDY